MGNFFPYMRGYLEIKVWGNSPERFMNLCSHHRIRLWKIRRIQPENRVCEYVMYIGLSDFFRLRPIARKTGTRAVVLERYGLPFLIQKMRNRMVFTVGVPCCFAFLIAMSQFVWAVDFEGNYMITDDVLMDFLEENGVNFGIPKNQIDMEALEAKLRENFDVVTWTSARIEGTRFIVKIKENDLLQSSSTEDDDAMKQEYPGSDLVANADGIIYSVLTRQGIPLVEAGDVVKKGDVLISGTIPVYADDGTVKNYQFCHADADILMDYAVTFNDLQPLEYEYKNYTGREKKNLFVGTGENTLGIRLHKCGYTNYDSMMDIRQVKVLTQIYLPFFYGFETHREYLPVQALYSTEAAEKILSDRLDKNIASLNEKGVQIMQKDVTIDTVGKYVHLTGTFRVRGPVGQSRPVEIQDLPTENDTDIGSNN